MIYAALKTLHVLAIIVWIGGMAFAHFFLRPAVAQLEPADRLRLMHDVLGRFFRAVLVASLLTLASGLWMLGRVAKQVVQSGGNFEMPLAWTIMTVLGVAMVAIFIHIRFCLLYTSEFEVFERMAGSRLLGLQPDSLPRIVQTLCEDLLMGDPGGGSLLGAVDDLSLIHI